jgi:hypothetical protein
MQFLAGSVTFIKQCIEEKILHFTDIDKIFKIFFSKIFTKIVKPGIKVKLTLGESGVTKVVYV